MTETKLEVKKETSNEIQTVFSNETLDLIKNTVAPKSLTAKEFEMFIYQAKRTGLDPLSRQIYCIKSKDKVSIQATIDGFRLIAERTGDYQGQTPVMWCGDDGIWKDVWLGKTYPAAAKVGVNRKGFIEPLYAIAKFDTYAQKYQDGNLYFNWSKMPDLMIAKCAEALALRKAFPQELSNIYSTEEMANFTEDEQPDAKSKPVKVESPKPGFVDRAISYFNTLKTKAEIETAFENAKTRDEYSALSEVEKADFDEKYLNVIAKFITADDIVADKVQEVFNATEVEVVQPKKKGASK